jgi:hypothetical protein
MRPADLLGYTMVHDGNAIGQRRRLLLIVRHVKDRRTDLAMELAQFLLHFLPQVLVKRSERLVHEQQWRVVNDGPRQCHALLLPARKLGRHAFTKTAQPDHVQHARNASGDLTPWQPAHLKRKGDILRDRHVGKQRVVLEHHADGAAVWWRRGNISAIDKHAPAAWRDKPRDRAEQRGFAGT